MNGTDTNTDKVLKGQEAMDLYLQGKDAWNAWAEAHDGWEVDFSGMIFKKNEDKSFEGFIFPGKVNFNHTNFCGGNVSFCNIKIRKGNMHFFRTSFGDGDILFEDLIVSGCNLFFINSYFGKGKVSFKSALFANSDIQFISSKFTSGNIDFERAIFSNCNIQFMRAKFGMCDISFYKSELYNSRLDFRKAISYKGDINFSDMEVIDSNITFSNAEFRDGNVSFRNTNISPNGISFHGTQFGKGDFIFRNLTIGGGNVSFSKAKFGFGTVNFRGTSVGRGRLNFSETDFRNSKVNFCKFKLKIGDADFNNSKFGNQECDFKNAIFSGDLWLTNATFDSSSILFDGLKVGQSLKLDNSYFSTVPDFRNLSVGRDVSMINMKVRYQRKFLFIGKAGGEDHSDMYRKLKSLAILANDHQRDLDFFAMEEKAKFMWHRGPMQYFPTSLYGLLSNFGRSIIRPFFLLLATGGIAATCFQYILSGIWSIPSLKVWFLSLLYLLPFVPGSRDTRKNLICTFYKGGSNDLTKSESNDLINACVELIERVAFAEGFFSLLFLFLIGLALRNRFRL